MTFDLGPQIHSATPELLQLLNFFPRPPIFNEPQKNSPSLRQKSTAIGESNISLADFYCLTDRSQYSRPFFNAWM